VSEITQHISTNPQYFSSNALVLCILGDPDSFLWEQQRSQLLPYAMWVPSFRFSKELTAWPGQKNKPMYFTHTKRGFECFVRDQNKNSSSYTEKFNRETSE